MPSSRVQVLSRDRALFLICRLRINARCQVVDMSGAVIAGLYCGGESAGGFSMHGLARCMCQGYIAGTHAAAESGTT